MDRATIYLPEATMGIVGMGGIGCEIARRPGFRMSVVAWTAFPIGSTRREGVESVVAIGPSCPNCSA